MQAIQFDGEPESNLVRSAVAEQEPQAQRTFTPSCAVLAKSAGIYHWTPEGRRLADFTSGVLVANLGHNPRGWWQRFGGYMGWNITTWGGEGDYLSLPPLTAYNAVSLLENEANRRLLSSLRSTPFGARMEQVLWAASGSEAVQKSLWACLKFHPERDQIVATRSGFHGKKGLAEAVTGDEHSPNRDPRVHFVSFPRRECWDVSLRDAPFDAKPYRRELENLWRETGGRLGCLITEPYLGGGGSYHPPHAYMQLLADFCREHDVVFLFDEVQANFGRTGAMYAFETYGVEPDVIVLGKGMGNGVPVNAAVGRADVFAALGFGGGSDTWSGHPLGCAATLATLDVFENTNVLSHARRVSAVVERSLIRLKELSIVAAVRGEGMVWGVELSSAGDDWPSRRVAEECVRTCYLGDGDDGIHLLGPLAGNVLRISPPLTITMEQAEHCFERLYVYFVRVAERVRERQVGQDLS